MKQCFMYMCFLECEVCKKIQISLLKSSRGCIKMDKPRCEYCKNKTSWDVKELKIINYEAVEKILKERARDFNGSARGY